MSQMNEQRERGPKDMETGERMAALTGAKMDALGHKARGERETAEAARWTIGPSEVEALIHDWPEAPKTAAKQILEQYGPPNEATPTKLFWYGNGPWKRTLVTRDIVTHNFPTSHSDFITNSIDYQVPVELFDEIAAFDGSCLVDRTSGVVAARCDTEAANIITLNLMHEIVTGQVTVEQARQKYVDETAAFAMGRSAPYAERLLFEVPRGDTADPDHGMLAGAMAKQAAGKVRDLVTGGDRVTRDTDGAGGAGGAAAG